MPNDSKEKILKDLNIRMKGVQYFKNYREAFFFLKEFAEQRGAQSRISNYNYVDEKNRGNEDIVRLQRHTRVNNGRELLELWKRYKDLQKRNKSAKM